MRKTRSQSVVVTPKSSASPVSTVSASNAASSVAARPGTKNGKHTGARGVGMIDRVHLKREPRPTHVIDDAVNPVFAEREGRGAHGGGPGERCDALVAPGNPYGNEENRERDVRSTAGDVVPATRGKPGNLGGDGHVLHLGAKGILQAVDQLHGARGREVHPMRS